MAARQKCHTGQILTPEIYGSFECGGRSPNRSGSVPRLPTWSSSLSTDLLSIHQNTATMGATRYADQRICDVVLTQSSSLPDSALSLFRTLHLSPIDIDITPPQSHSFAHPSRTANDMTTICRLYTKGRVLGHKRGKRNSRPNQSLVAIEGVDSAEAARSYLGKVSRFAAGARQDEGWQRSEKGVGWCARARAGVWAARSACVRQVSGRHGGPAEWS